MGNGCCKHTKTEHQIVRTRSGKILNRFVKKQRKFRTGLHVEKTSQMGAEANFQAALTTDIEEKYTTVNSIYTDEGGNKIPTVSELVSRDDNTDNAQLRLPQQQNNIQQEN